MLGLWFVVIDGWKLMVMERREVDGQVMLILTSADASVTLPIP